MKWPTAKSLYAINAKNTVEKPSLTISGSGQ